MTHPDPARLSDFARGLLEADRADEVERHLAECPECCERAASAGKDGFIACLQSAAGRDTHPSVLQQATQADTLGGVPPCLREHPRYRVLRLLGKGGMGEVWLAEHRVMQRLVALKVIRRDLLDSPDLADRFVREVLAAGKLSHPNIVAALDAEQAGDTHFLVMEFVDGSSIAAHVRAHGPLPVAEACSVARQAALALQHAHERGLVHRDIKPENLLRGSDGTVKVADFGLARVLRGPEAASTATSAGLLVGTVDFIAPEQANDPAKSGIRSDIYALGCSLYHMLAGQVPYPGGGILDKLARHMAGRPMRLGQLRPDVPLALTRVVERMMSPDPAKRFASPGEAAQALEPFTKEQARKPAPRRWPWAAAAALLLA
ncbi:MAG: protein kinase, partial [Gemmataceae bacterium]|nr:protein kinase [Gemmataceae bacterium]